MVLKHCIKSGVYKNYTILNILCVFLGLATKL